VSVLDARIAMHNMACSTVHGHPVHHPTAFTGNTKMRLYSHVPLLLLHDFLVEHSIDLCDKICYLNLLSRAILRPRLLYVGRGVGER
jgi:hypothetical protein